MAIDLIILTVCILFFGYFSERISKKISIKKLFAITQFGWVACYGLIALSGNFMQYAVLDVIGAGFRGAYLPIAFAMVGDFYSPEERGAKFGWLNFGLILGSGGGLIFGNLLGGIEVIGWRLAYGVGFILAFLAVLGYARRGITPERGKHEPDLQGLDEIDYDYKITLGNIKKLFQSKSVTSLIFSVLLTGVATTTLGIWAIDYFENSQLTSFGGSARLFAMLFYIMAGLGALPGNIQGGKIGDKHYKYGNLRGRVTISLFGLGTGLACMFCFYLIPLFGTEIGVMILAAILILGLGFLGYWLVSFPVGNQFAIYSEVCVPEVRSTANALHGVMVGLGGAIGNFFFAITIIADEVTSIHVAILLLFWVAGAALWIIPFFTYPKEAEQCREIMLERRGELEKRRSN